MIIAPIAARAQTIVVSDDSQLSTAISILTASGGTIIFNNNITLSSNLPAIDITNGSITIDGGNFTLSGAGTYQGLTIVTSVSGATATIQNLTIANTVAAGGAGGIGTTGGGGGGGAGLGGALFVGTFATVAVNNVNLLSSRAVGGAGGGAVGPAGADGGGLNGGLGGGAGGVLTISDASPGSYGGGGGGAPGGTGPVGGAGGFGGGAGGSTDTTVVAGGFGGGSNGGTTFGGGGSGLGAGVFIQSGGLLQISGAFTVNGNTVTPGAAGGAGAGSGSALGSGIFFEDGDLTFNSSSTVTIADGIASANNGGIIKAGTGTLVLGGNNAYSGGTQIDGGTVSVSSDANLGTGTFVDISDGTTLAMTGTGTFNKIAYLGGTSTMSVSPGVTATWNGLVRDAIDTITPGTLYVNGGGTLVLANGTNQYGGGTVIYGNSTVSIGGDGALGFSSGSVTLGDASSGGTLAITTNGSFSSARSFLLGAGGGTIDTSSATNATLSGSISGTGGLTKDGGGTLTLSGSNSYSGPTTVNAGTLFAGSTTAFGSSKAFTIGNGATLDFNGYSQTLNTLDGSGTLALSSGATMTIGASNANSSFGGSITGSGGIVKNGSGTLTLSGTNTFGGGITVNSGTLSVGSNVNLGGSGGVSLADQTTFAITGSDTFTHNLSLAGAPRVTIGSGNAVTWTGTIAGGGSLQFGGGGSLTLTNTGNTYAGGTLVTGGSTLRVAADAALGAAGSSLSLGDATSTATLAVDGTTPFLSSRPITIGDLGTTIDTTAGSTTLSGVISGNGGITKAGAGTLTLAGNNTYFGPTVALAGTLRAGSAHAFGTNASLTLGSAATFDLNGFNQFLGALNGTGSINLGGGALLTLGANNGSVNFGGSLIGSGGIVKDGSGTLTLSGTNTYTGGTFVNGGVLAGNVAALQGNIVNNASVVFNQASDGTYAGSMSGKGSLTKNGAGTLFLTGTNTYGGGTFITGGAVSGNSSSIQGFIRNDASLVFDQSNDGVFNGGILGVGSLTKLGPGTLSISSANLFTGLTTITQGTLALDGAIGGSVLVGQNGTFRSAGVIGGSLSVSGQLSVPAPGSPLATYNAMRAVGTAEATQVPSLFVAGNLNMAPGSVLDFAVTPNGAAPVVVGGSANLLNTRLSITVNDPAPKRESSYLGMITGSGLSTSALDVTSPIPGIVPVVKSNATQMVVTLLNKNVPLAITATTGNGTSVGNAIDRTKGTASGDYDLVIRELTALDDNGLANALLNLAGELHASELRTAFDDSSSISDMVRDVISDRDHDGDDTPRLTGKPSIRLWFQLSGDHATYSDKGVITGTANTGGGGGGFDFHPTPRFTLGAGGSFSRAGLSLTSFGGSSDLQAPRAFGYGGMKWGPFNFHGGGSAARTAYTTTRPIQFNATVPGPNGEEALSAGIDRVAEADQSGIIRDAWTEWQDTFKWKDWVYDWKIGWRRATQDRDPFAESGAGSISLDGLGQTITTKEGNVNIHVFRKRGNWRPNILVNYRRQFADDLTSADVQFAGQSGSQFVVNGLPIPIDEFHGIFGLTMRTASGLEYTFEYETRRATDESHHGVHFRVRFR